AWEKGSNENHNRMIRRFFPKGTDFSRVSKKRIAAVEHWMNHYPRKILGWCCPADFALVV
ncbi:MAG: IS30 family transposase, partial [Clostridiales bacterium]|nr:IS30 family transposase [Candidatus Cacconaster stercorequi]